MKSIRDKRRTDKFVITIVTIAIVYFIFGTFTIVSFKEHRMLMFTLELSPINLINGRYIEGWVFGKRILKTEYGEITLNHWSRIAAQHHGIFEVFCVNFQRGRAIHNLSIDGMVLPREISIRINRFGQFGILALNNQEINISSVPIVANWIYFNHRSNPNNITFAGHMLPKKDVILSDTTQISFLPSRILHWGLYFHNETETWCFKVTVDHARWDYFLVKLPGETEFQRYTSIRFGQHWGNFIDGVLAEGEI